MTKILEKKHQEFNDIPEDASKRKLITFGLLNKEENRISQNPNNIHLTLPDADVVVSRRELLLRAPAMLSLPWKIQQIFGDQMRSLILPAPQILPAHMITETVTAEEDLINKGVIKNNISVFEGEKGTHIMAKEWELFTNPRHPLEIVRKAIIELIILNRHWALQDLIRWEILEHHPYIYEIIEIAIKTYIKKADSDWLSHAIMSAHQCAKPLQPLMHKEFECKFKKEMQVCIT